MPPIVTVEGLRELNRALAKADREVRLGVRREERDVAEPVRRDVEALTAGQIRGMAKSPQWAKARTGVTQKLVYVAPRQRGVKRGNPAARPNLAILIRERALDPAEEKNAPLVKRNFEEMLDRVAHDFNRS